MPELKPHHRGALHTLTLFASMSTLVCCALPALMVALGAGAAMAGLISAAPQLVVLSEYKVPLFIFAGGMLAFSGVLRHRNRYAPCPADPELARACRRLRRMSAWVFGASVMLYLVGFFFAFVAVHLF
jgi:hypothetical protein